MKKFFSTLLSSTLISLSFYSQATTVGEIINPVEEFLKCDTNDPVKKQICSLVSDKVNEELTKVNLSFNNGSLVYKIEDGTDVHLSGGCTRSTSLKNSRLDIRLDQSANIDLSGNAVIEPVIFGLTLPVDIYARFDITDKFGVKAWPFGCKRYASDSYYADTSISTNSTLVAYLSLEPKYTVKDNEIIVMISPIFDILASTSMDINDLDLHGVSPFSGLLGALTIGPNTITQQMDDISHGEFVKGLFVTPTVDPLIETTTGAVLTDYTFNPIGLKILVKEISEIIADKKLHEKENKFISDTTAQIRAKITDALNLDSHGNAYFVFNLNNFHIQNVTQAHMNFINPPMHFVNPTLNGKTITGTTAVTATDSAINFCLAKGFDEVINLDIEDAVYGQCTYYVSGTRCTPYSPFKVKALTCAK